MDITTNEGMSTPLKLIPATLTLIFSCILHVDAPEGVSTNKQHQIRFSLYTLTSTKNWIVGCSSACDSSKCRVHWHTPNRASTLPAWKIPNLWAYGFFLPHGSESGLTQYQISQGKNTFFCWLSFDVTTATFQTVNSFSEPPVICQCPLSRWSATGVTLLSHPQTNKWT